MKFSFVVVAAALSVAATAAPAPSADRMFSADRVRAHVTFLADDLLEGRGTGSRGHEIAARYVAAMMASYGLVPGARDGGWFQRVTLQEQGIAASGARLTVTGPAGSASFVHGVDIVGNPSAIDATTDIAAPLVFAGYGIDAPAKGFDDYAGLDVRGKIVVVLASIPQGPPDEVIAHLQTQKAQMAAAHGAIGVIIVPTPQSTKLRPWSVQIGYAATPRMTWVAANGSANVPAPAIKATMTLDDKAAAALFAGAPQDFAAVQAAAAVAGAHPKGFALVTAARFTAAATRRTLTSPEVIGMIPGSDPVLRGEFVVLMAHVDHLGIRAENAGDKIYNGALDNAAGVAVMLEVARAFAGDARKPKRSLLFVANTAEEKGLLGAEAFANDPSVPIGSIVSVVDLDQPLLLYNFTDVIAFGADHSTLGNMVARAVAKAGVKLAPDPMPEETIFVRSDHYTFVKRGVPALLLATGYANGGEAAWKHYLANDYHKPTDDLSLPIDWQAGAKYARVNYLITREIADAPQRPRWFTGDYFGATFAPDAPKVMRH